MQWISLPFKNLFIQEFTAFLKNLNAEIEISRPDWHPGVIMMDQYKKLRFHLFFIESASENQLYLQNNNIGQISDDIQELHIWQDLWFTSRVILMSRISSLYGKVKKYHARETVCSDVSREETSIFLNVHHLQGSTKSRFQYGLYQENNLLAIMTFSKGRILPRGDEDFNSFEIIRFCNHGGTIVNGAMGKLMKNFVEKQSPDDLVTYVDKDWSKGRSYKKLGFEYHSELPVQEFWLDKFTGRRLFPEKIKRAAFKNPESAESVESLFQRHAIAKVYNAGSIKMIRYYKLI
ncbi:MAG: hypothetical protein JJU28_23655 [Cyclobacteriaceae bacterium]|nr:hypothetical protein [Cyclobacteriaceae bacterium]